MKEVGVEKGREGRGDRGRRTGNFERCEEEKKNEIIKKKDKNKK